MNNPVIFHYGERGHIEAFFSTGAIQIGTLRYYNEETHGDQIGDNEEGYTFEYFTEKSYNDAVSKGLRVPEDAGIFFGRHASGNLYIMRNRCPNYAVFCTSAIFNVENAKKMKKSYSAAIRIDRIWPFFHELSVGLEQSGFSEIVRLEEVAPVRYGSRQIQPGTWVNEAFVKPTDQAYQAEVRAIWTVDENPKEKIIIHVPRAIRACTPIYFDEL